MFCLESKRRHPEIKVGLEMVLQSLMDPGVRNLVDSAYKQGDYLGMSRRMLNLE